MYRNKLIKLSAIVVIINIIFNTNVSFAQIEYNKKSTVITKTEVNIDFDNEDSEDEFIYDEEDISTGLISPDKEAQKWIQKYMFKTQVVRVNQLGLQRANTARQTRGLPKLEKINVVPVGQEVLINSQGKLPILNSPSTSGIIGNESLPSVVDNSLLDCFPSIRSQGKLSSCAAFATTYYQMTHMVGLARGWNSKDNLDNTNKFSPKWTYNLINKGQDNGSWITDAYELLLKHGALTWSKLPYSLGTSPSSNYLKWPTDAASWREAINYRMDKAGYVEINGSDNSSTPVVNNTDSDLLPIKQMLTNGYVLVIATNIGSWKVMKAEDNLSTNEDDQVAGKDVCYMVDGELNGHAMTVVGYNDNIWVDINNNGKMEEGEKGAFKIANSWGKSFGDDGFCWFAYDALNKVSSIQGAISSSDRQFGWGYYPYYKNRAYWITARNSYTPQLLLEFTAVHRNRNDLYVDIGWSNANQTTPAYKWVPFAINYDGNQYSFNGNNVSSEATFVFDATDLLLENKIDTSGVGRWYLNFQDKKTSRNSATLKKFKLIDVSKGTEYVNDPEPDITVTSKQISPIKYVEYSSSLPGTPSSQDPAPNPDLINAFDAIQAEDYSSSYEAFKDVDSNGISHAEALNKDFIEFDNINFASTAGGFEASVASDTSGGKIQIRIDSTDGPLLAECKIPNTGFGNYVTKTYDINLVKGVHSIFLVFYIPGDGILQVDWFKFKRPRLKVPNDNPELPQIPIDIDKYNLQEDIDGDS